MKKFVCLILLCFFGIQLFSQWELQALSEVGCLEEVEFTSNSTGFIVGNSVIGKTINGGETWAWDTSIGGAFRIIDFINPDTALICCFPYLGEDVMITYDGGETWDMPPLYISVETNDMELIPDGNVINAVGWAFDGSKIYVAESFYTENSSESLLSSTIPPYDIDFVTNEVGFVCGRFDGAENTSVFKTIDGGYNWYTNENMTGPVFEMSFPSITIGYGIGDESRIWKTIDSGESWNMLPFDFGGFEIIDDELILRNIYFFNDTIGYLEVGIIYPDFTEGIYIYRSIDGGNSWYKTHVDHKDFDGINSSWCTSPDTCYAVECTEIYKTTNGGGIDTSTSVINTIDQAHFTLTPNPATDMIQLTLPSKEKITSITTFNALGERIDLQFDEHQIAGTGNLPPGIYITTITTETGKGSKKWVKL